MSIRSTTILDFSHHRVVRPDDSDHASVLARVSRIRSEHELRATPAMPPPRAARPAAPRR